MKTLAQKIVKIIHDYLEPTTFELEDQGESMMVMTRHTDYDPEALSFIVFAHNPDDDNSPARYFRISVEAVDEIQMKNEID
jgi:hypothetical protein